MSVSLPDADGVTVEFDLALHQMALNGDQSDAARALWNKHRTDRVHLLVDRLARAVDVLPEPDAANGIAIDKVA